jgi:imidazolonepropionase-like amidohydrolase
MALAGRAIAASGGHGTGISVEVDGPDAVRRAVRLEIKGGADCIKLMMTGGTATPGERVTDVQLTLEETRAAVEEAHRRGKGVAAHCSNLPGTILALDAGVDSIEHGIELDETVVHRMADAGVRLAPSLRCTEIEGTAEPGGLVDDFLRERAAGIYRRQFESFQLALAGGVRIVAATDSGPRYFPVGIASLADELATMVGLGMTPSDAICSATSEAATLLGWDAETGTIKPGQLADLVIVDGDPTADIRAVGRAWHVMARGRTVRDGTASGRLFAGMVAR